MALLSIDFAILFFSTFALYSLSPAKARNYYLLAASCLFIAWNNPFFLVMSLITTLFTFVAAQVIERNKDNEKQAQISYFSSIVFLVGLWILFHNPNLLSAILPFGSTEEVHASLIHRILYPLGMSFYTFQSIGYLTDVYWQEEKAEKKLFDFSLYMLFFLKFLSGPIERYNSLIEQIRQPESFNYDNTVYGLKLFFLGMMKKLLIANYLSPYTADIFGNVSDASGLQLLMTCLIYPIELYTDFSGYTDMALGGARMFGIRLSPNFNFPFSAKTTADLWRRWHMSLSFWVRDYLFLPMTAALRKWKRAGIYISLLVTFSLLGLWHGIGFTFLIYGLIQGTIICLEMRFQGIRTHLERVIGPRFASVVYIIRTYLLFAISLIFFRADTLEHAIQFITHISFIPHHSWKEMNIGMSDHFCIVAGSALLLLLIYENFSIREDLIEKSSRLPLWARWCAYFLLVLALFSLGMFENDNFIYLQF